MQCGVGMRIGFADHVILRARIELPHYRSSQELFYSVRLTLIRKRGYSDDVDGVREIHCVSRSVISASRKAEQ
jgi:hypothetical protein